MIPKVIHYCWLSDDLIPNDLKSYMQTWDFHCSDFQKIHWNFSLFDINQSLWVKEAFENKKYAFAADYIRLFALYKYGGFYLDMDVEITKSFIPLLKLPIVLCWQKDIGGLEVAAFGVEPQSPILKTCLARYENRSFVLPNGKFDMRPLPNVIEDVLINEGYKLINVESIDEAMTITEPNEIPVFPPDYFSPKSYKNGKIEKTNNTYCIHHFAGSWISSRKKMKGKFIRLIGDKATRFLVNLKQRIKGLIKKMK